MTKEYFTDAVDHESKVLNSSNLCVVLARSIALVNNERAQSFNMMYFCPVNGIERENCEDAELFTLKGNR